MSFSLKIKEKWKGKLAGVCHIDQTARAQSVTKSDNPKFWNIINEFNKLTQVPAILNTSFNSSNEPIVESINDAMATFLTSGLDVLVIGSFIINRKTNYDLKYLDYSWVPKLMPYYVLTKQILNRDGGLSMVFFLSSTCSTRHNLTISALVFNFLSTLDGIKNISKACIEATIEEKDHNILMDELWTLWERKVISVSPK
jgi:carbamoyltransferase